MPPPRPSKFASGSDWRAEIGPYNSETAALATLADIAAARVADASRFRVHRTGGRNGAPVYSLHLAGLSEGNAAQLCGVVSASEMACNVVPAAN
jgi:hypothetical protein